MNWKRLCLPGIALFLAACQAPKTASVGVSAPFKPPQRQSVEITPAGDEFTRHRTGAKSTRRPREHKDSATPTEMMESELYQLPKITVTQEGFRKLGLSVVTNTEVLHGGNIEWMRVGVVLPGSVAAREGLRPGMEVLAINQIPVSYLTREQMLHMLFELKTRENVRLLVNSRSFGLLPHFVTL